MLSLLTTTWGLRLAKWAAVALAIAFVLLRVRDAGRQAERVNTLTKALDAAKARNDVEISVGRQPAGAVVDELHRDWSRD
ncbi:hypothetical protein [Magnetospirillum sulfuroxidans]|uniref:Uncharacterized protein n=1 Tax=Magnetospirillum sulfuroxidans TaxID=611300 RepID=A0ABS5I8P2_9PROT|nr:hypothetical protein [Magnetospirillum sulfuroxidans]MBR9970802.1 hypothetical protein [Magnetospirillum sulfuroxidans]